MTWHKPSRFLRQPSAPMPRTEGYRLIVQPHGQYTGMESGADVSADLNLDDFLVFENNQGKAVEFFRSLIFKHYPAIPWVFPSARAPEGGAGCARSSTTATGSPRSSPMMWG